MKTRSQTNYENSALYEVNINFDEASKYWKENKRYICNGTYKYVCAKLDKNNNCCKNKCLPCEEYCKVNLKMFNEGKILKN
jgi:hypothetical protein